MEMIHVLFIYEGIQTAGNDTSSRIGDSNRGTIIGLTVGGSLLLILLLIIGITLSILCMKKRSDSIKKNEQQPFLPNKPGNATLGAEHFQKV